MAIDPTRGHYVGLAVVTRGALVAATVLYGAPCARPGPADTGDAPAPPVTRRAAAGLVVAVAFVLWVLFKEGFVRQDTHRLVFFASLPLIVAALALGPSAARPVPPARVVALLLVASFVAFAVYGAMPSGIVDPVANTRGFVGTVRALALPDRHANVVNERRARTSSRPTRFPRRWSSGSGTTPSTSSLGNRRSAWAYPQWRWDPLPTLQHYFAYTDRLDDRDADVVASDSAPRYVLRRPPASIDGRRAAFDARATQIAIVCHYREADAGTRWQLLERGGERCGPERDLGSREIRFGESVDVPSAGPNEMRRTRFDLHLPWWWRVADLAYKAPQVHVRVDDAAQPNRFVVGTAGQPHLLVPASTSGYAARFDEPPIGRSRSRSPAARPAARPRRSRSLRSPWSRPTAERELGGCWCIPRALDCVGLRRASRQRDQSRQANRRRCGGWTPPGGPVYSDGLAAAHLQGPRFIVHLLDHLLSPVLFCTRSGRPGYIREAVAR